MTGWEVEISARRKRQMGCGLAYRSYAPTHGNLSAPRSESQNTNKVLRFWASLSEHEAELSLTVG